MVIFWYNNLMKKISKNLPVHLESVLLILLLILVLLISPNIYSKVIPYFALLDQSILFNTFVFVGLIGIIFYVVSNTKRVLGIPYSVSAFILGMAGYNLWPRLINLPNNLYLILGVFAVSFVVFKRGLNVDVTGSKKEIIKSIVLGIILGIVSFIFSNFVLKSIFPNFSPVLIYGLTSLLLILGSHIKSLSLHRMDSLKFSFDMTVLVILYNFLLFSSRININSFLEIGKHINFYSSAFVSSVYGVLIGLIGAYLLHRHHLYWKQESIKNEQNIYSIGLLCGVLALSVLVGANPFIASAVMGLLVTIRDAKENPEEHILSYFEAFLGIFVFLVLGSNISFAVLGSLLAVSSGIVFLISFIIILGLSLILASFSRFHIMPKAKFSTYLTEILNRQSISVFVGALTLFILSNSYGFNNLFVVTTFIIIVYIYYIYPIISNSLNK